MPSTAPISTNPFALMIDPQAILDRIECSERLERLQRRVCRPLDKPLLPTAAGPDQDGVEANVTTSATDTDSAGIPQSVCGR